MVSFFIGWNDYDIRFECLNITFLQVCEFITISVYWLKKDEMFTLLRALGSEKYEYDVDEATLEHIKLERTKSNIEKRKLPFLFTSTCLIGIQLVVFRRPLNYLISGEIRHSRDGADLPSDHFVGGIPIPYWCFIKPKGFIYYIAAFLEYYHIIYVVCEFTSVDSSFLAISYEICTEFKILHYMLKNLVETSEQRYEQLYTKLRTKDMEEFKVVLKNSLKSCVLHHQQIIRTTTLVRQINYTLLVISGVGMGMVTCMLGVIITLPETSSALKMSSLTLMMLELSHVFFYCYYSDRFKELSIGVGKVIYESNWIKYSNLIKTEMMIVVERSKRPVTLAAGGFSELTLEAFAAILNSAYTYFNIIKAMS